MSKEEKLSKITITRGTVFDGEVVDAGTEISVDDRTRPAAVFLILKNKAVEGTVEKPKPAAVNRQVAGGDLDKK